VDCELPLVEELFTINELLEVEDGFVALEIFVGDESTIGADPKGFRGNGVARIIASSIN
jgi:hypothetical protein